MQRDIDGAWRVVQAAAERAEDAARAGGFAPYALEGNALRRVDSHDEAAVVAWRPGAGWEVTLPPGDPRRALIDLYLPVCSATSAAPIAVGHLGQSLDGFIATQAGESQYVTGPENLLHMHRMRALCDAVIVGAGTVAADDPQLTTRHVPGPSPLRVILDPTRRLGEHYRVFSDDAAATLYVCARSAARPDESHYGRATLVGVDDSEDGVDLPELLRLLRARGCRRIFVEGGGVTVSLFLEANLLDRLQMAIAPLIIGEGRPAIRLPAPDSLSDCHRPRYRVFRMGGDVLFDCDLRHNASEDAVDHAEPAVTRII
jgi:diaminohydroxyphosphoribosylaminopyrimidine deaminase / 5-amino-6-(5-phosphoribosylamino)uracil reductase